MDAPKIRHAEGCVRSTATQADEDELRKTLAAIQAAVAGVDRADAEREATEAKIVSLSGEVEKRFTSLDPASDETVRDLIAARARRDLLRDWLTTVQPVARAVEKLQKVLCDAKIVIRRCAEERCPDERHIHTCSWHPGVLGVTACGQSNLLRAAAKLVLRDLEIILAERRPPVGERDVHGRVTIRQPQLA
jgi:hypothetical protein